MKIQDIINVISTTLNQSFGDGYKIHEESIEQGLKGPCFFILPLSPTRKQKLGNRYHKTNPFVVHYFPATKSNSALLDMAEQLYDVLEYITLLDGDVLNGTDMHYEIVDDVLEFFVSYNADVFKVVTPEESMGTVSLETGLKG